MRNPRFEAWFADRCGLQLDHVKDMWDGSTYRSWRYNVEIAWAAWCEALGFATS